MMTRASIVREWHYLCILYYKLLLDGCLDEARRFQIGIKINYHKNKLADLATEGMAGEISYRNGK